MARPCRTHERWTLAAVRPCTLALLLVLAGAQGVTAQEPPRVTSDAPVLAAGQALEDPAPAFPPAAAPIPAPVPTDLAALVAKAHPVVQGVMGVLVAAVLAVLTVLLFKAAEFWLAFARLRRTAAGLQGHAGLPRDCGRCPLAASARAALAEAESLPRPLTPDLRASARERLDLALARIEAGAVQRLRSGTGLLASIGAVAPFVGLFGTVFGIMNSFLAIAETRTTSLAVVAPGIAEALLATGIGLAAAIPAVLVYNQAMRLIAAFRHRLADGTAEVLRRFSRELDARMGG